MLHQDCGQFSYLLWGWGIRDGNHYTECQNSLKFTSLIFVKHSSGHCKCLSWLWVPRIIASDSSCQISSCSGTGTSLFSTSQASSSLRNIFYTCVFKHCFTCITVWWPHSFTEMTLKNTFFSQTQSYVEAHCNSKTDNIVTQSASLGTGKRNSLLAP